MGYQLGIDVGTTYTAAAVCRSSERRWAEPEVVTLGTRSATVPSVLFVAPDGGVVVGEAAERRAVTDPDRVVREFKRRIGDPTPVIVAGRAWAPEELSAQLVRWVADRVAEREGGPADRIAVTHPAAWGQHKKDLFGAALAAHGLRVTFLAEPQAAALHYAAAERVDPGSTIAVYDLGGGTFDAAVVRKGDPAAGSAAFGLLGRPEGLERLGGIDFDDAVFGHVVQGMPAAFAELDDTDPAVLSAVARIRRECTEAKEALSSDTEVSIPVLLPASQGSVRMHRSEFEAMIRPQLEETVSALRGAVVSAGLMPEQLTAVLLVGGSSRIPLVAQLVSEQLGRPVAVDADPKNAIAKGAALAVSPKPTASWPGVAIAPVPQGPAGPTVPFAPPPRPVRSAAPLPPPARPAVAAYAPVREPATAVLPPDRLRPSRQAEPAWQEPEPGRRPSGLLIGLGGLVAVAAVVAAVLLWPEGSESTGSGVDTGPGGTRTQEQPAEGAPPPATGSRNPGGSSGNAESGAKDGGGPAAPPDRGADRPGSGPTTAPPGPTSVVELPVDPPVNPTFDPPVDPPVDPVPSANPNPGTDGGGTPSGDQGNGGSASGTGQPEPTVVADEPPASARQAPPPAV